MSKMKKLALAVITNWINSTSPYLDFLKNASKYGHNISQLIIGYSHGYKESVVEYLSRFTRVKLLKLPDDSKFILQLKRLGLNEEEINTLFYFKLFKKHKLIPYGIRRNSVLMQAMLSNPIPDYLFFIDTDVYPYILKDSSGGKKGIDFFGRHLEYLKREGVVITTSDYSGYYIIPPMSFTGLKKLLLGLQKETAYKYLKDVKSNIEVLKGGVREIRKTNKILGGNHAIDLGLFGDILPYFSTYYFFNNEMVLGRGEDTLLGRELVEKGKKVIDIDTRIFHDTYGNFPQVPDIKEKDVQERFYYASSGWLGRNPFLNWYLDHDRSKLQEIYMLRREALVEGSKDLSRYLNNSRFNNLPLAFDASYSRLEEMKGFYYRTLKAWLSFKKKVLERGEIIENTAG
jgi:hypothetical protein